MCMDEFLIFGIEEREGGRSVLLFLRGTQDSIHLREAIKEPGRGVQHFTEGHRLHQVNWA